MKQWLQEKQQNSKWTMQVSPTLGGGDGHVV